MSFFKTVVILGVGIALLPSDREQQRALTQTALAARTQASSFCDTRPNICLSRADAWDIFRAKAVFAYALGTELVWGQQPGYEHDWQRHGSTAHHRTTQAVQHRRLTIGTLIEDQIGGL